MGLASKAIFDVESLRGDVKNVIQQQHAINVALENASTQLVALRRATAVNKRALNQIAGNVTELHSFVSIQARAMTVEAQEVGLATVMADPKQVYQLQASFSSVNSSLLQVSVSILLRPVVPHLDFTLWKYSPLPIPHAAGTALVVAHSDLLTWSWLSPVPTCTPAAS